MLLCEDVFKRLLIFLFLLSFGLLLLYMDYLQEVNFYQNKLQLPEFKVNLEVYKLLEQTNMINANRHFKAKFPYVGQLNIGTTTEQFYLRPPFPEIDLSYIGPVFIEDGLIHLYCEYSFGDIRCTVGGKIPATKSYFQTTYLTNPKFESISVNFTLQGFFKNLDVTENWIENQILKPNEQVIELLTNYVMLFGANGTNIKPLLDENSILLENSSQHNHFKFVYAQISVLIILIYLKLLNFILFAITMALHFVLHIPIYYVKILNFNFAIELRDNLDIEQFKGWFDKNNYETLVEDEIDFIPKRETSSGSSTAHSSLRFRGSSKDLQKRPLVLPPPKAITIHGKGMDYSPFSFSTSISLLSFNQKLVEKDIEKQDDSLTIVETNDFEKQGCQIPRTKTERIMDYYCLAYFVGSFGVLVHLVAYEIVNTILYNLITSVFLSIETSDPKYMNVEKKSIFDIPNILLTGGIILSDGNDQILNNENFLFSTILNFFGCLLNLGFALFFHSIYAFMIYRYTITIY